jgi:large repetitive protein
VKRQRGALDDAGFTLVEMLVVVVIEAMIVTALGSAFVLVMNNSTTVKESLARTNDARFAASYIVSDARNSSGPETSLSDTASCPDPSPPVSGSATPVVRFNWNGTTSAGATRTNIVNYVLVSNALLRRYCLNGALVSDTALATNVASVAVACAPTANCSGTPTKITATITATQGSSLGAAYQYSVTGAFRKALAVGAIVTPQNPKALIALGTTGCGSGATGITISGGSARVYGDTFLNTLDGSTCKAMNITAATYQAGGTQILTGGSCTAGSGSVCPTATSYTPAIADPYANLAAPSTSGLPSRSGCAGGTALPGVYAAVLSITSACSLASGTYIMQAGLSVGIGGTLTNAAGGVLVYITGGSFSVSSTASVTLSAMTSGTYSGLVAWQAAANTSAITFSNSGVLSFTGALYAPKAQLSHSTTAAGHSITTLVVQNLVNSSGALAIGTPSSTPLSMNFPSAPPTSWTVNRPYPTTTIGGVGGDGNYIWSVTGFPAGMTLDANTGVVSGTPTAAGSYSGSITLNDLLGDTPASTPYTLTINAAPSITTTSPLPAGDQGIAYSTTLAKSGGTAAYTWSATGPPAGLTLNSSTGVISGTPTATGTATVAVTLTDGAGATATKNLSLTINALTITSVTLANGGVTQGRVEQSDTISVVFSADMGVSSFCSTWSGDGSNQSLNSNNDVTVTLADGTGATNDSLTVTSATCTFRFGSINLGSNAYLSGGAATFSGATGPTKSTITWTAATRTLTITLGAKAGAGTVATVTTSTPVYTASGLILGSGGAAISNSPFTLAAAKQF